MGRTYLRLDLIDPLSSLTFPFRLYKLVLRNRMKSHALGLSRSNEGILSYENGAYEEATREDERGVDLPLGRHAGIKNGRGEVYRISVDDNNDFESPDYDGSDLSTASRQR